VAEVQAESVWTRRFLTHARIRAVDLVEVLHTDPGREVWGQVQVIEDLVEKQHVKTVTMDPSDVVETDLVEREPVVNLANTLWGWDRS
jgi:hypothetical protein